MHLRENTTNYCISGSDTISSEDYAARINSLTSSGTSKINFYIGYDESLTADMEISLSVQYSRPPR